MIEQLHNHLVKELQNCNTKESIYVILEMVFFVPELFMILYLSRLFPSSPDFKVGVILYAIVIIVFFVINAMFFLVLYRNYKTRIEINNRILAIYQDSEIEKYTKDLPNYSSQKSSLLPMIIVISITLFIILVPLAGFILAKYQLYLFY